MSAKKTFGQIWSELTSEQAEYLKGYVDRQRQDAIEVVGALARNVFYMICREQITQPL